MSKNVGEDPIDSAPCQRAGRTVHKALQTTVRAHGSISKKLLIGWQEVDRLLFKSEFAAALLVTAVNIEFTFWENLRRFTPSTGLASASQKVKSAWGQVDANKPDSVTLSSLIKVSEHYTQNDTLQFSPPCQPLAGQILDVRNRIAHERDYFALLTRLEKADWPENRIRKILDDAKAFCHGNAP